MGLTVAIVSQISSGEFVADDILRVTSTLQIPGCGVLNIVEDFSDVFI